MPSPDEQMYSAGEVAVLERLAKLEANFAAKFDQFAEIRDSANEARSTADQAIACSRENSKDIDEIKAGQTWLNRAAVMLIGAALINFIINFLQGL